MILKVISNFNIDGLLKKLENFNIFFANQSLYISDIKCENENDFRKYILNIFTDNSYIQEINNDNIDREYGSSKEWCKNQISWANIIKSEKEEQEKIKNTMDLLERVEQEIFSNTDKQ